MSLEAFSLRGKVALVTGANTGLGQGVALALAEAGADIVAAGRSCPDKTRAQVEATGRRFFAISVDLFDVSRCEHVVTEACAAAGSVDILINNAGAIRRADALDFSEQDWDDVLNLNLKSVFFLSQAAARRMIGAGGGKIINIASMLSFQGGVRVASYTASKSGVAGLTKLLANEWASKGVNVNAIAPGYFATNNTEALYKDETRNKEILSRIPAGSWGDPSDLGGAAVFLSSPAARYVHGVVLPVDGGWLAR